MDVLVLRSENVTTRLAVAASPNQRLSNLESFSGSAHDKSTLVAPAILVLKS